MFYVLYYKKNEPACRKESGFDSRELAFMWLKSFIDDVDWYSIEEVEE